MNKLKIRNLLIVSLFGTLMVFFQNCSQSHFTPVNEKGQLQLVDPHGVNVPDSIGVIVTDEDNNIVTTLPVKDTTKDSVDNIDTKAPEQVADVPKQNTDMEETPKQVADVPKQNTDMEETPKQVADVPKQSVNEDETEDDDLHVGSCLDVNKSGFSNVIDIAQLADGHKLDVIKGSVFIYSSTGNADMKQISINTANGKTVLCGLNVSTIGLKSGRLDLIKNTVVQLIEKHSGIIKVDSTSQVIKINSSNSKVKAFNK